MKTTKTKDQLYNRIMINFGIGALSYALLYFLYLKLYMKNSVTFLLSLAFIAGAIVCFVLSKKKPTKNYGYMFLAFALCLLFTRLSVITTTFIGLDKFISLQEIYFFKKIMQTRIEVILISWAGALYLFGMLCYNLILIKSSKRKR